MTTNDDLLTMLYFIIGLIVVLVIIDQVWLKPYQERKRTNKLLQRLGQKNRAFYQKLPKYKGVGIVTVVDNSTVLSAGLLIITLRHNGCRLPILICYAGNDLSIANQKFLTSMKGVSTLAIGSKLDLPAETLQKMQIRAYALIYSPFRQVLLLEPDLLLVQNPEILFNDPLYRQTGALFWKDRKIKSFWDKKVYNWVRMLIPYRKGDNLILDKKGGSYQSQDLLLIDKNTHLQTLEKLFILTTEWETVYNFIPGDKESYWIAAELAKEPYTFVDSYPGAIGDLQVNTLCDHVLYLDSAGNLLGWNKSLFSNENERQVTDFTHYSLYKHNATWTGIRNNCLLEGDTYELPEKIRQVINEYARLLHELKAHFQAQESYDSD